MGSLAGITLPNVPVSITLPVSSFQPISLSQQVMVTSDPGFGPLEYVPMFWASRNRMFGPQDP
jgi:hypothetical protein